MQQFHKLEKRLRKIIMKKITDIKINFYVFYTIILLALFSSLRILGIGADFDQYTKIFSDASISIEPIFALMRKVSIKFGGAQLIFFICNIIALSVIYGVFKIFCNYPNVAFIFYIFTFFLLHEYTQIRVAMAISILFLSIEDLKNCNFKIFCFKTIFATCFHYSAVFMFFLYFFCTIKRIRLFILIPIFCFLIDLVFIVIFNKNYIDLSQLLSFIMNKKDSPFFNIIFKITYTGNPPSIFNKQYLLFFSLLLSFYYFCIKNNNPSKSEIIIFKIFSFAITTFYFLLLSGLSNFIYRISEFYLPISIISIDMLLKRIKEKDFAFMGMSVFILIICYIFAHAINII